MARAFRCVEHKRALLITFDNPIQEADGLVISLIRGETVWLLPSTFIGDNTFLLENSLFMFEEIVIQSVTALYLGFSKNNVLVPDSIELLLFHNSFFIEYCDLARYSRIKSSETRHDLRKNVAIFTHVGNDISLLQSWERYYTEIVEPASLYVLNYGTETALSNVLSPGVNIVRVPRGPFDDRKLVHFCSTFQRFLLSQYRVVVHSSVDDRLVHPSGLKAYLQHMVDLVEPRIVRTAQAYDLVHDYVSETEIDLVEKLSLQRKHLIPNERHKKPVITTTEASWGLGFYTALEQPAVTEDEELCLVHLSEMDLSLALASDYETGPTMSIDERREQIIARLKDPNLTVVPDWMKGVF